jgi:methanogenic corrinoid protein MtbC1
MTLPEDISSAVQQGSENLMEELIEEGVKPKGKAVIGTVKGDTHDTVKTWCA